MFVNLKSLISPNNFTLEFTNEVKIDRELYGITQDPETKNYMMSLDTPNNLSLEFANEIKIKYEFYGIAQDPETDNFMMNLQIRSK
ncbi:unnamed protein product [Rhizophagus irregularis]|nr:unnamed protein product [Rhizophagus irregularis]